MKPESGNRKPERLTRPESGERKPESGATAPNFQRRTFDFGVRCVRLVEALPKTEAGRILGRQLLRCGTGTGANYRAAQRARSRVDFIAKMGVVEEEADESLYWLEMLIELGLTKDNLVASLRQEANEIISIVVASIKTARDHGKEAKKP